jgi:hypothetical protein
MKITLRLSYPRRLSVGYHAAEKKLLPDEEQQQSILGTGN